jgi:hypothetical protein
MVFYPILFPREAALVGAAQPEPTTTLAPLDADPNIRQVLAPSSPGAAVQEPAAPALSVIESITLFDGTDPNVFASSVENPIRLEGDGVNGYAHIVSTTASPGARAVVGPGLAQSLVGKTVRLSVAARSSAGALGAATLRFAYEAAGERSPWKMVLLNGEFSSNELIWRVPVVDRDGHAILVEPLDGEGAGVDVEAITIEVLAP